MLPTHLSPPHVPILVIQTSFPGFEDMQKRLEEANFQAGRHFLMFNEANEMVKNCVNPEHPQLLIMGSINGDTEKAGEFASSMTKHSNKLHITFFSSCEGEPKKGEVSPFHNHINKDDKKAWDKIFNLMLTITSHTVA